MFALHLLPLILFGCQSEPERDPAEWAPVVAGPPVAGAAERAVDVPIGTPMGGYTARCTCFGGTPNEPDKRDSPYADAFVESAGVQTAVMMRAIWLENGNSELALLRMDAAYATDKLVAAIEEELSSATGVDMVGKVLLTASHSHGTPASFTDQMHFYLGGDRYNEEVFRRYVKSAVDVTLEARASAQPAAIGFGWAKDWDPEDHVYRDRRPENDALEPFPWGADQPTYQKDPYLALLRVDALDGTPIALAFGFGMHGTLMGEDNPLISTDSTGGVEMGVQEAFDRPVVVMHWQTATGDASPAGRDREFARQESLGLLAVDGVMDLYGRTPVSADPIEIESVGRAIPTERDTMRVTRNGTEDLHYAPFEDDDGYLADGQIFDADGSVISPIDEFNTQYGGAFCGDDTPLIPGYGVGADVYPYSSCVDLEPITLFINGAFDLDLIGDGFQVKPGVLPLKEDLRANTLAFRIGNLATLTPEGEVTDRDLLAGAFPGEPTWMYVEQWRRRAKSELGYEQALAIGYAQDHEGYLLIPEDWLVGGYEPNINTWGPLQAEHIMEGVLEAARVSLGDGLHRPMDPRGDYGITSYDDVALTTPEPDLSPDAGTILTSDELVLWVPEKLVDLDLTPVTEVPLVSGQVQIAWVGGDPSVDNPVVTLQRLEGRDWVDATTRSGRPVTSDLHDILLSHTPDPLYPPEADQTHRWWAAWQAVGHVHAHQTLQPGVYRLHVVGQRYAGGSTNWPFNEEPYEAASHSFEVLPGLIQLTAVSATELHAWLDAGPRGWRLVDLEGSSTGENPLTGEVVVTLPEEGDAVLSAKVSRDGTRTRLTIGALDPGTLVRVQAYGGVGELRLP